MHNKKQGMPAEPHLTLDLDPTTNYQLHLNLWDQLTDRLKKAISDSGASGTETDHTLTENLSDERKFGKDMRCLLKLVLRAILNPGEKNSKRIHYLTLY